MLVFFGLFAIGLAGAMGTAGYFAANNLSLELIAKRCGIVIDTLIQAEKQTRSVDDAQFDADKLVSALDLDFLVGKQLNPQWSKFTDGLHVFKNEDRFIYIKRVDGISYALCGPMSSKKVILDHICSMFVFCGIIGSIVAIFLAIFLANRLSLPIRFLIKVIKKTNPEQTAVTMKALVDRNDEIGLLARTIKKYQKDTINYIEREKFFTRAASHELRTPLTIISHGLEVIETQISENTKALSTINRLSRTTNNMSTTVAALLCLTRGERQPLVKIDIKSIILQVLCDFVPENSLELDDTPINLPRHICISDGVMVHISGDIAEVWGQERLAAIVYRNLLENAFRHSNGCDIFIDLSCDTAYICNMEKFMLEDHDRSGFGLMIAQRACNSMKWHLAKSGNDVKTIFRIEMSNANNDK